MQPDEIFRGRPEEEIKFHKGDIVEILSGNEVSLAIVVGTPLTTRWVWEKNQSTQDKRGLDELTFDESDDSYTVIDGPGFEYHEHINAMYVFNPHFHVPIRIERRFKGYLEKAEYYQRPTTVVSKTRSNWKSPRNADASSVARYSRLLKSQTISLLTNLRQNVLTATPTQ